MEPDFDLTVYYCSRQGVDAYVDSGFGQLVQWDIPLLEGYHSKFLPNLRSRGRVGGFWSLINPLVVRELTRGNYDALWVHGHNYLTYLLAYATARFRGIRIFTRCETHLLLQRGRLKRILRWPVMSLFYKQCDACLAIGSRNAEYYSYHGVSEKKIFMAPYTVDNNRFINMAEEQKQHRGALKAKLGIPSNVPVVLYASKYSTRKRPGDVLKAKKRLESEGVECSVVMIGSGEMEPELRAYCVKHELRHVHFLGFMNQTELPRYYTMADVFVLPSENEPWGLVINEVMCAGVAIIASAEIGAVVDLVKDGNNGFTYPAGNVAALTECIRKVVTDPDLASRYGAASRRIIEDWGYEQCISGVRAALVRTFQSQGRKSDESDVANSK